MRPKVIIHSMIGIDGRLTGFEVDMDLYYGTASELGYDAALVGSNTVLAAIPEVPPEEENDRVKKTGHDSSPYLVLVDSKGAVRSQHVFRRLPYIREIIVLVSRSTPGEYLDWLRERQYDIIISGDDRVDLEEALSVLGERYGIGKVRTDSGDILNSRLVEMGLVDEISLLIAPYIVGGDGPTLFRSLGEVGPLGLELKDTRTHPGGVVQLIYSIDRKQTDHNIEDPSIA